MQFMSFAKRLAPLAVVLLCSCTAEPSPPKTVSDALATKPVPASPQHEPAPTTTAQARADEGVAGKTDAAAPRAAAAGHADNVLRVAGASASLRSDLAALGTGNVGTRGRGAGEGSYGAGVGMGGLQGMAMIGGGSGGGGTGTGYGSGSGRASVSVRSFGAVAVQEEPPPVPGGTFVHAGVNGVVDTKEDRFSTFAIDVDSGSWMYARRFLKMGRAPDAGAVRVEEFVNAMHYDYAGPDDGSAFAVHVDAAPSPFTRDMDVVRVAIQGKRMTAQQRKPAHLTFLVDVSGSMNQPDKLPWVGDGIDMAVDALRDDDSVAIVTYAGETRLVLPATSAKERRKIHEAVATLVSGGGTNMGSGMELAYREANKQLASDRTSRVIVLSDGDANIGHTSYGDILQSVKGYVSEGVTMSTMGFGSGNYNDNLMEQLADAGNGNYTYIDSQKTLRRFFVDEMTSTLEVIAQDAKIQVEWNPDVVARYRLIGYENRDIADKDFRNDKKDAGEIGAGHAVTALYEIARVDPKSAPTAKLATVRVRHKIPRHETATEIAVEIPASDLASSVDDIDDDAKAALGMALGAEILRGSEHAAGLTLVDAAKLLRASAKGRHAAERNEAAELFEKAPARTVAAR